jgi:hypothetical protein
MAERQEHEPGTPAPATGHYEELNVFGTPTGRVEHVREGERLPPMLGLKRFRTAAITIAGIELLRRISKGQFNLARLRLQGRRAPAVWDAVLAAQ